MEGQNLAIEYRWGEGSYARLAEPAAEQAALCVFVKTKEPQIEWHIAQRRGEHLIEFLDKADLIALSRAAIGRTQAAWPPEKPPVPSVAKGTLVIGGGGKRISPPPARNAG